MISLGLENTVSGKSIYVDMIRELFDIDIY